MSPPTQFNYKFLVKFELARFQGRDVPRLTFQSGAVLAHVYALPIGRFTLPQDTDRLNGNPNLQFFRGEDAIYIVDCPGGQLGLLLHSVT
jgi:hypothetical protein